MPEIKEGKCFLCIKELSTSTELLYREGHFYRSLKDHSIIAENQVNYYGFNKEMFEEHFIEV